MFSRFLYKMAIWDVNLCAGEATWGDFSWQKSGLERESLRKDGRQRFFFRSDKDPFDPAGSRRGIQSLQIDSSLCSGDTSTARFLSHPRHYTPTNRLESERQRGHLARASVWEIGCHSDGVSHSHVWDQRSRFMGGARWAQWCSVCHHGDFQ